MTAIHSTEATTSPPEQFVAGLTDFGPGRSKHRQGRPAHPVFTFFGKRVPGRKAFDDTVRAIEASNAATNRAEV